MNLGHDFDYDVIVLGSGLLAAHLSQDASERGLQTLWLAESDLVGGGLSAFPRLLQSSFPLDPQSSNFQKAFASEVELLRFRASHLVENRPLLLPLPLPEPGNWRQRLFHRWITTPKLQSQQRRYLRNQGLSSKEMMVLRGEDVEGDWPGVLPSSWRFLSHSEVSVCDQRWCLASAASARQAGAVIRTYANLEEWVLTASGKVRGVKVRHQQTGQLERFTGYVVINAMEQLPSNLDETLNWNRNVRFKREVHLLLEDSSGVGWQESCDGTLFTALPMGKMLLVTMRDPSLFHHPDLVQVTKEDVLRILDWCSQCSPELGQARLLSSQVSYSTYFSNPFKRTRTPEQFSIFHHKKKAPSGLISAVVSDSVFVRKCAQEVVDKVCKILKVRLFSTSKKTRYHVTPTENIDLEALYEQFRLPKSTLNVLFHRHGNQLVSLLHASQAAKGGMMQLCSSSKSTVGEIQHVLEHEWVHCPEDLLRRVGIGLGACLGTDCIVPLARLYCESKQDMSLPHVIEQLQNLLLSYHSPILYGSTLQQKCLHR